MNSLYTVILTRRARKDIDSLDKQTTKRVSSVIDSLELDARPAGCLKVKSEESLWRVRVGDYRIGYEINDATQEVTIIRIGHRSEFYD